MVSRLHWQPYPVCAWQTILLGMAWTVQNIPQDKELQLSLAIYLYCWSSMAQIICIHSPHNLHNQDLLQYINSCSGTRCCTEPHNLQGICAVLRATSVDNRPKDADKDQMLHVGTALKTNNAHNISYDGTNLASLTYQTQTLKKANDSDCEDCLRHSSPQNTASDK